jgi:hypothetical protein
VQVIAKLAKEAKVAKLATKLAKELQEAKEAKEAIWREKYPHPPYLLRLNVPTLNPATPKSRPDAILDVPRRLPVDLGWPCYIGELSNTGNDDEAITYSPARRHSRRQARGTPRLTEEDFVTDNQPTPYY